MKFNWGKGIAAVYLLFMIGVLTMVYIFMNQDVTLETENYYAKGVEYQNHIDKMKRTNELPEQININQSGGYIYFLFPKIFNKNEIKGSIFFYRPSNDKNDFTVAINLDSVQTQSVPTSSLQKGLWKIKIDWLAEDESYYNEKLIMVN